MVRLCRRLRTRTQRGAVALEAALVLPVLLAAVFGIIEFSFVMRDHEVVVSDTRAGARIASTGAGAGQGTCPTGQNPPPCVPANVPALAQMAADTIQRQGSAMPPKQIQYILVYKANAQGYPGADGNSTMPTSCSGYTNCVKFTWYAALNQFKYNSGSWQSSTINACFPGNLDRVGVQLVAHHNMLSGFFGHGFDMSDHAVMDFEPLATQICASGAHQ